MSDSDVRSIVYFWWRKSEKDNLILKFGDHTEPLSEKNWYTNTEKYIQRTAAPRESKTFKDLIEYEILDITEYAKSINRNRRLAKVDNYIANVTNLNKYRIGQTDQFRLRKYEMEFEDFINKVKDVVYGSHNRTCSLPLTLDFTYKDVIALKENKEATFEFPLQRKETDALTIALFCEAASILIISKSNKYEEVIDTYKEFNNFLVYHNNSKDVRFEYASKRIMICEEDPKDYEDYNIMIKDDVLLTRIKIF